MRGPRAKLLFLIGDGEFNQSSNVVPRLLVFAEQLLEQVASNIALVLVAGKHAVVDLPDLASQLQF